MSGPRLYWLDLETTGLDPAHEGIMEIAVFEATIADPFAAREIYHSRVWSGRALTDPFVIEMHTRSGLLDELRNARSSDPDAGGAENDILYLIPAPETDGPRHTLAGASVHLDLGFLRARMPRLAARFSHRLFDVSAMALLAQHLGWQKPEREAVHRARADVLAAIEMGRQIRDWLAGRRTARYMSPDGEGSGWLRQAIIRAGGFASVSQASGISIPHLYAMCRRERAVTRWAVERLATALPRVGQGRWAAAMMMPPLSKADTPSRRRVKRGDSSNQPKAEATA